ncbi:MAG TPA: GatB/YqeY domain-containing protein [bacterium]|nr:GatB/YqeY domain-containing protein [Myxococcales bacterium]OQA61155.1 MAG: Yqey-like protein [bacterium ADurb.Bin270]HPW44832.1 GatB/YqeY domain-containing protein [bacterium]HQC50645.1 GatB/YqeY domain-containing protein [bacterium]HQG13282.1 GatB/YqeY domain-containing protein [bacterium]
MKLKKEISQRLKEAMKAKDADRISALRLVLAAINNREIEKRGELDEGDCLSLLSSLVKQRMESIEMFKQGGRDELAAKEEAELLLIRSFLPEQLSESDISGIIESAISETGASGIKDLGKVMKVVSPKVKGRADGKLVSDLVKQKLS